MDIRELTVDDLPLAAQLRITSWENDYAGTVPSGVLQLETEALRMKNWLDNAEEDHFKLIGAFDGDRLAGFTGGAFADTADSECGYELYYLFVDPAYRGQKLSLQLLSRIIQAFQAYCFHEIIVYNFAKTPSNSFYRKLGGQVRRSYVADVKGTPCAVDIFAFDAGELARTVSEQLG